SDKNNSCLVIGQAPWSCKIGDIPQKNDLTESFATSFVDNDPLSPTFGQTFLFVGIAHREVNGDNHIDIEFNQRGLIQTTDASGNCIIIGPPGTEPTCGRSLNDFIVSADFLGGGSTGDVTLRKWLGTAYSDTVKGVGTIGVAEINFDSDKNVD